MLKGSELAGYAQGMWNLEEGGPIHTLIRVHPNHLCRGIGSWALAWGEALAAERGSEGVRAQTADRDVGGRVLLTSRGYIWVRSSFTMVRKLVAAEDAGTVPNGLIIGRRLRRCPGATAA